MDWESSTTDRDPEQEAEGVKQAEAVGAAADQVLVQLGVGPVAPQPAGQSVRPGQPTMATLPSDEYTKRLESAQVRIDQANLYREILKSSLFEPGSGDASLITIVEDELKTFITERLEVLLGMRTPTELISSLSDEDRALLQFLKDLGPNGRAALQMLANKMTGGATKIAAPTEQPPKVTKPSIRRVKAVQGTGGQVTPPAEPKPRKKYQKTDNPDRLPMPTPEQEAAKYAAESEHFGRAKGLIVTVATDAAKVEKA